jgi:hypothetical protein
VSLDSRPANQRPPARRTRLRGVAPVETVIPAKDEASHRALRMIAFTPIVPPGEVGKIESRLAFLHRAHARLVLFEAGQMDIAEALEGLVASLQCSCRRALVERWERDHPPRRAKLISKTEC